MGMLRFLFLLVLIADSAGAQETRIAAVVNEDVISVADLDQRLRFTVISAGIEDTPQTRQRIGPQVLRTMIDEKLQVQEAKRLNVKVSEAELAAAITRIEGQNSTSSSWRGAGSTSISRTAASRGARSRTRSPPRSPSPSSSSGATATPSRPPTRRSRKRWSS